MNSSNVSDFFFHRRIKKSDSSTVNVHRNRVIKSFKRNLLAMKDATKSSLLCPNKRENCIASERRVASIISYALSLFNYAAFQVQRAVSIALQNEDNEVFQRLAGKTIRAATHWNFIHIDLLVRRCFFFLTAHRPTNGRIRAIALYAAATTAYNGRVVCQVAKSRLTSAIP